MSRNDKVDAVRTLRALHDVGAINLDVLVQNAGKVRETLETNNVYLEPGDICYLFTVHIGPRQFDLVKVASEIEELGYTLERQG